MKILIVGFLILILASLGSALYFLFQDKGRSTRTVRALTLRVGLSMALFLLLMLAHFTGLLTLRGSGV
ncbi:MAG: twin transmembrane helix small protein [Proteobacteria bacterium]|nr:twin transmembrane helix small protein [Burkholderiales bacterium]